MCPSAESRYSLTARSFDTVQRPRPLLRLAGLQTGPQIPLTQKNLPRKSLQRRKDPWCSAYRSDCLSRLDSRVGNARRCNASVTANVVGRWEEASMQYSSKSTRPITQLSL